ncbi:MAG: hypothetical protein Q9172_004214 [Xanthocarpia lactea]
MSEYSTIQNANPRNGEVTVQCAPQCRLESSAQVAKTQREDRVDRFGHLPPELLLDIMRWTYPQDLGNLVQINKNISALASSNKRTIIKGIHTQQFPDYHELFGMIGEESPDQEYNAAIEKENREWWICEEDERFEDWFHRPRLQQRLGPGSIGRINLFAGLSEGIKAAATALKSEGITFDEETEAVTIKALLLFWKMQWNDRPGLEDLGDRDGTERSYLDLRHKIFVSETAEVKGRFQEILRLIGSRLWKVLEFSYFTIDWSKRNILLIASGQHISAKDLESWVQDLTAELVVDSISKIGVVRAIKLDYAYYCGWDTAWINEKMVDRLLELLDEMAWVLRYGAPAPVFEFGRAMGLWPEDVVDRKIRMFTDLGSL